jgi:hypothetical protein
MNRKMRANANNAVAKRVKRSRERSADLKTIGGHEGLACGHCGGEVVLEVRARHTGKRRLNS